MKKSLSIMWFEQDLRLSDNPAFTAAAAEKNILAVYIHDDVNAGQYQLGGASSWWLHQSLCALNSELGGNINFYKGDAKSIITDLCNHFDVNAIFWNRRYEPWRISRDKEIKKTLLEQGVAAKSFNAALLKEPWQILKKDGTPYKIFTPYYRQTAMNDSDVKALPTPQFPESLQSDSQAKSVMHYHYCRKKIGILGSMIYGAPVRRGRNQRCNRFWLMA